MHFASGIHPNLTFFISLVSLVSLVMTTPSFEAALTFVEQVPYDARPILLLVDVDPQEPHHYQHHYPNGSLLTHDHYLKATNGAVPDRLTQANGRHARAASDNAKPSSRARRPQTKSKPTHDANLTGLQFLETVLQGLAKGCIGHVVPIGKQFCDILLSIAD